MTTARSYNLAVEAVGAAAPAARASQLALEVISRTGLGANPLQGNPAVIQTYVAEVVAARSPQVRAAQLTAETISRSGLGANPIPDQPAYVQTLVLETIIALEATMQTSQLTVEVASRSEAGVDPLTGNPAVLQTLVLEVARYGWPLDENGNPVGTPGDGPPGIEQPGTCHCIITPQLPPARNLMRRPGRFP